MKEEQIIKLNLGRKIRRLRKMKGLSQEKLAEKAGITYKYLGLIEIGKANPSLEILLKLSSALGVPLHEIFKFGVKKNYREGKEYPLTVADGIEKFMPEDREKQKLLLKALRLLSEVFKDD